MNLISVNTSVLNGDKVQTVDARKLHEFLGVGRRFTTWIKQRIEKYQFVENQDYIISPETGRNYGAGRLADVYHISLDMAKELSMVENNDKGRSARRYFIECERIAKKSQNSLEWKQARLSGKQVRRSTTDAIQQLVEYATAMGSKSATYYYSNITKMEYKALGFIQQVGIKDNLRDRLNLMQLNALAMAESVATAAIEQGLDEGLHYKDIYALAKLKVTEFADTISWMKLASPKQGKSLT